MLLIYALFLSLVTIWALRVFKRQQKYGHMPGPSPWLSLPVVGHGYLFGSKPLEGMEAMRRKYGDIFIVDFGNLPTAFVCGNQLIFEALSGKETTGKPWKWMEAFHKMRYVDSKGI